MCKKNIGIGLNADWIEGDDTKLKHCLDLVKKSGANCTELIMHSMDVILNGKLVKKRLDDVKKILNQFDFIYTIHMPYKFDASKGNRNENLFFFKSCIDFAKEINAKNITVHCSAINIDDEPNLTSDIDFYKEVSNYADKINIGIENPYYSGDIELSRAYLASNPINFVNHLKKIDCKNCGITLDFGHCYLTANKYTRDYVTDIKIMSELAIHLHVHDNFGKHGKINNYMDNFSDGIGDLHLPPTWGEVPWEQVMPIFKNFNGVFMLETEFRLYPYFKDAVDFLKSNL